MKRIAALFASKREAYVAVSALFRCGFPLDDIGVAVRRGALVGRAIGEQALAAQSVQRHAYAAAFGALGGAIGLIAGAAAAMPVAKGPLVSLGIVFALAIAAIGIAIGAAAGCVVGDHSGLSLARQAAGGDKASDDGFLVTVDADGTQAEQALAAIRAVSPLDVDVRSASWASEHGPEIDPAIAARFRRILDEREER